MDSWHGEIYEEIEKVAKSSCTVAEGMSVVVAACARHRSHPDWKRFAELDFLSDLEHLRGWLLNAFSSPPAGEVSGLWFGLFNPVYDGEDAADIYVSGSPYDPKDPDWACAVTWKPSGAYARSRALKAIFDISYGEDGLSYGNAFDVLAPQGREALDEPAWRIDLQVLALADRGGPRRVDGLVARAGRPVRGDGYTEGVLAPHVAVGDRLPRGAPGSS